LPRIRLYFSVPLHCYAALFCLKLKVAPCTLPLHLPMMCGTMDSKAPPSTTRVLVLGSSVSTGCGADNPEQDGWFALMRDAVHPLGFKVECRGLGGTNVVYWGQEPLPDDLDSFGVVMMCLSLGNEGLAGAHKPAHLSEVEQHYLDGLHYIAKRLRQKMSPNARLVLGGPYPNNDYKEAHLEVLLRVHNSMCGWDEVDHVIDFLQPCLNDGKGNWHAGASTDPGHPNNTGHQQMFACLSLQDVLGQSVDSVN